MEPIYDSEIYNIKSKMENQSTTPKKDDKKKDMENEKKKQSYMTHWKYKPGPNSSMTSFNIYNNNNTTLVPNNQLAPSSPNISHPSSSPSSGPLNNPTFSPQQTKQIINIEEPPNSPEIKKGRRNSAPNINNFITHWKFDPRAQQKQQRQQQLIGQHQQQMYLKRMSSLNLHRPSSPETTINIPEISIGSPSSQVDNTQRSPTFFHPYSGRPRAPSMGNASNIPSSPRYDIYSSSPPNQPPELSIRNERRMSLPNVPYQSYPSPIYFQQPPPPPPTPFISNQSFIPPSSPLSSSSTPRGAYLDTIPEIPYPYGNEYSVVGGCSPMTSPYIMSTTPSPPYSPLCASKHQQIQPTQMNISASPIRRMSVPSTTNGNPSDESSNNSVYKSTNTSQQIAYLPNYNETLLRNEQGNLQPHSSQPVSISTEGNKLPSMRDLLNNLNIKEQQKANNESNLITSAINEKKEDSNEKNNNSKMCIINLVQ